jgi:hypothetical protein
LIKQKKWGEKTSFNARKWKRTLNHDKRNGEKTSSNLSKTPTLSISATTNTLIDHQFALNNIGIIIAGFSYNGAAHE